MANSLELAPGQIIDAKSWIVYRFTGEEGSYWDGSTYNKIAIVGHPVMLISINNKSGECFIISGDGYCGDAYIDEVVFSKTSAVQAFFVAAALVAAVLFFIIATLYFGVRAI